LRWPHRLRTWGEERRGHGNAGARIKFEQGDAADLPFSANEGLQFSA
jgi:hypothetical protein